MSTCTYRRTFWRELRRSLEGCRFKLSLRLCLFEEGFSLDLFGFLIPLLFLNRWQYMPHEIMESWGPYYFERTVCWTWGDYHKSWYMPWMMTHLNEKHVVMLPDGSWTRHIASYEPGGPDGRWYGTYPYRYKLRDGTVQEVTAKICVERREWRQRWLKWCPLFASKSQSIEIEFSGEVGERAGSWKGGCIGCGYDMLPGETAEQTLRRMESERTFR